jgi:NAD(P)H-hydrate epimerase
LMTPGREKGEDMKLVSVEEMQAVEREADASGLSASEMMENAGRNLADVVREQGADSKEAGVLGLVGSGNNGGDTLVALARLAALGWNVNAYLLRPRPEGDPLLERLVRAGGKLVSYTEDSDLEKLTGLLEKQGVLLDGVLGTGFHLPLKAGLAAALGAIRRRLEALPEKPWVVAVDCPSGVDCDSGEAAPETIPADLTVTMAAIKQGLLKEPAHRLAGEIRVVGIGLDEEGLELPTWRGLQRGVPDRAAIRDLLPARPEDAHKGTFGAALVAAGSQSYTGAALLSGEAAYRIGAGLVTLAVPASLHPALAGQLPEATWILLPEEQGSIAASGAGRLHANLGRATALLLGPGFGLHPSTAAFLADFLNPGLPPVVIDADGLKLLAQIEAWPEKLPASAVLTPHPGEMAVLTGLPVEEIQANRMEMARGFSREWGHVVVLKGAFTVIAEPGGCANVIPVASPALARAGTGDVLAGMIAGLRAQGVGAFQAATAGAWIHAQAGLLAAAYLGNTASVLAGDVLGAVPEALSQTLEA